METIQNTYPALDFSASELSAFAFTTSFFTISLKNGQIINFTPDDTDDFYKWLLAHNIRDIQKTEIKIEEPAITNNSRGWKGLFKRKK